MIDYITGQWGLSLEVPLGSSRWARKFQPSNHDSAPTLKLSRDTQPLSRSNITPKDALITLSLRGRDQIYSIYLLCHSFITLLQ